MNSWERWDLLPPPIGPKPRNHIPSPPSRPHLLLHHRDLASQHFHQAVRAAHKATPTRAVAIQICRGRRSNRSNHATAVTTSIAQSA